MPFAGRLEGAAAGSEIARMQGPASVDGAGPAEVLAISRSSTKIAMRSGPRRRGPRRNGHRAAAPRSERPGAGRRRRQSALRWRDTAAQRLDHLVRLEHLGVADAPAGWSRPASRGARSGADDDAAVEADDGEAVGSQQRGDPLRSRSRRASSSWRASASTPKSACSWYNSRTVLRVGLLEIRLARSKASRWRSRCETASCHCAASRSRRRRARRGACLEDQDRARSRRARRPR